MGFVLSGEETAPERAISYRCDTKLAAGLKKADLRVLDVSREGAVFDLDGSDRVDFIGTAEGGGGNLAKTKVLDFSFPAESQIFPEDVAACEVSLKEIMYALLQFSHGFHCFLNRCFQIYPMAVIQVNSLNPQSLQTLLTRFPHVFGITSDLPGSVGEPDIAELGRKENFIALPRPLEPFAN